MNKRSCRPHPCFAAAEEENEAAAAAEAEEEEEEEQEDSSLRDEEELGKNTTVFDPAIAPGVLAVHRHIMIIGDTDHDGNGNSDENNGDNECINSGMCCNAEEVCLELSIRSPSAAIHRIIKKSIHSDGRSGFSKWQRPEREVQSVSHRHAASTQTPQVQLENDNDDCEDKARFVAQPMSSEHPYVPCQGTDAGIAQMNLEASLIEERSLVEFLCAKKRNEPHFLDGIVMNANVYDSHPWHFMSPSAVGCLYFCCTTKYTKKGNMTRNRMTREGGRWKQQGIVQPILRYNLLEPSHKTYLSYIPCGQLPNSCSAYFIKVPSTPGRVKHRHRMIEIALDEDLELEKKFLKDKLTPKPFLVVCVLRNTI